MAVYFRCERAAFDEDRFFRAVIEAHSRAREYAATTPRRSILQSPALALALAPDLVPNRGQIGNVLPGPKKHRCPHFANNADRSPICFGATRDHLCDLRDRYFVFSKPIYYTLVVYKKYIYSLHAQYHSTPHHRTGIHYITFAFFLVFLRTCGQA